MTFEELIELLPPPPPLRVEDVASLVKYRPERYPPEVLNALFPLSSLASLLLYSTYHVTTPKTD